MKTAVSSKGAGLGAWIEPDLVKCGFLVIVDENSRFETIENNSRVTDLIKKAIDKGIQTLVTGNLEEDTFKLLKDKNVNVHFAQEGSVLELIEKLIN